MRILTPVGLFAAMLGMLAADLLPHSPATTVLRVLSYVYMGLFFAAQARAGYRRRRPYWTAASWRRFLLACSIPVAALLMVAAMLVALDWRLPILGPPQSRVRGAWVAASLVFMVIGAGGIATALHWLAHGEPSRQFALPTWRARRQP